uniref:Cystatin domain-containing protein n=1 Tax=Brassica campestris TaxID=3711 RepID=M4DLH7_BRACM
MNNKTTFILFLALVLCSLYVSQAALTGGWSPISDVKNARIVEIGEFAVSEYNKQSKSGLKFVEVVSGESQIAAGMNYRLILADNEGVAIAGNGESKKYEAVVWEKPWLKSMNLTSFKPAMLTRKQLRHKALTTQKIGEFAVSEYDKQSKSGLKFVEVVSGESQIVAGMNYRLIVAANEGIPIARNGESKKYEAIVWDKPWLKSMNLTSFKPAM